MYSVIFSYIIFKAYYTILIGLPRKLKDNRVNFQKVMYVVLRDLDYVQ